MYKDPREFVKDAIITATPAARLMMLLDRLEIDLKRAEQGFVTGDAYSRNVALLHAQEIVLNLRDTLRVDIWQGAAQLKAIYSFIYVEFVQSNIYEDKKRFDWAKQLLMQIIEAWRGANKALMSKEAVSVVG
ncbi:MAG: flagellar protein FliS [Actinomycetota bacterium]|nr:flagellar protein FliS [Actinomycetota bacterium]